MLHWKPLNKICVFLCTLDGCNFKCGKVGGTQTDRARRGTWMDEMLMRLFDVDMTFFGDREVFASLASSQTDKIARGRRSQIGKT